MTFSPCSFVLTLTCLESEHVPEVTTTFLDGLTMHDYQVDIANTALEEKRGTQSIVPSCSCHFMIHFFELL